MERERDDLLRDEPDRSRLFAVSVSRSLLLRVFSFDFGRSLVLDAALLLPPLLLRDRERAVRLSRRSRSLLDDDEDDELELDELELDEREPELCDDELLSDELKSFKNELKKFGYVYRKNDNVKTKKKQKLPSTAAGYRATSFAILSSCTITSPFFIL